MLVSSNDIITTRTDPLCGGSNMTRISAFGNETLAVINPTTLLSSNVSASNVSYSLHTPISSLSVKSLISRGVCSCRMCFLSTPTTKHLTDHLNSCHNQPTDVGFVFDCSTHLFCNGCNRWLTKNQRSGVVRAHNCNFVSDLCSSSKRAKLTHIPVKIAPQPHFLRADMTTVGSSTAPKLQVLQLHDSLYDVRDNQGVYVPQILNRKRKHSSLDRLSTITDMPFSDTTIPICADISPLCAYPSDTPTQSIPNPLFNDIAMHISMPAYTPPHPVLSNIVTSIPTTHSSLNFHEDISPSCCDVVNANDCFNDILSRFSNTTAHLPPPSLSGISGFCSIMPLPKSPSELQMGGIMPNPSLTVRPPSVFGVINPCITVVSQSIDTTPNASLLSVVSPRLLSKSPVTLVHSSIEDLTDTNVSYITPEFRVESLSLTQVDDFISTLPSLCPALPLV